MLKKNRSFWKSLLVYMGAYRSNIGIAVVSSAFVGVAVALQPLVIKFIVDDGINRSGLPSQKMTATLIFIALYIFLSLFRVFVWTIGYRRLVISIEGLLFELRTRFFRHIQYLCFRFHDRTSSGEMFNYIFGTPINSLKTFLQQFCLMVPYQFISWIVVVITLSRLNLLMTFVTLLMAVFIVLLNRRSVRIIRQYTEDFMEIESTASRYVADMLRGSRAIKIHAIEERSNDFFSEQMNAVFLKGSSLAIRQHIEHTKPEGLQYICIAVIYMAGSFLCIYGKLTVGAFFAFISSVNLLMSPLLTMLQLNLIRVNAESGLERIEKIINIQTTTPELPPAARVNLEKQSAVARKNNWPVIEYKNVGFRYRDTPVFKSVNCTIMDGESIALVGPSGSGKTTFINLLLRLYDPQSGSILFNGADLRYYSIRDIRSSFGVVPQDPFLFQMTIRENVTIARPDATEEEILSAMESAYALEFVQELPDGWNTEISENGMNFSGGQKQRIAIVRAILANPKYYIFDEATSALDNESEKNIQSAMKNIMAGHTSIVIAHRLSTVRNVDRILVFERGFIVQEGRYEQLAEQEGLFKSLLNTGTEIS
jgi:ABC-type multidrug transport system fused ATPase/permease subunit